MFEWLLSTTAMFAPDGPGAAAPSGDGGEGGGAAAPVSGGDGDAHPTSTKPDDGGGDDPDAFNFLDQEGAEEGDEPAGQEPAPQDTSSPQQGQPKPEDVQPKPDKPQEPQVPQPGEQPKPVVEEPAAPETQPTDDGSPASVLKAFEEGREAIIEQLAEQRFSMTQEEVDAFQEDPGKFLPRFAAEAYLDAVRTSISYMQSIVPGLALRSVQLHSASSAAAEQFFGQFPDLRAHAPQVEQVAKALRQTHPQMPQSEFQERLGVTARAALGLQQPQQPQVKGGNGQTKVTPAPFQPASASAPAHQQVPASSDNPWDSINEALLNPEE